MRFITGLMLMSAMASGDRIPSRYLHQDIPSRSAPSRDILTMHWQLILDLYSQVPAEECDFVKAIPVYETTYEAFAECVEDIDNLMNCLAGDDPSDEALEEGGMTRAEYENALICAEDWLNANYNHEGNEE